MKPLIAVAVVALLVACQKPPPAHQTKERAQTQRKRAAKSRPVEPAGAQAPARDHKKRTVAPTQEEVDTFVLWAQGGVADDLVEILQKNPGIVNRLNRYGWSALHWAALGGHMQTIALLLRSGANPNLLSKNGETPVDSAAKGGETNAIALLVKHGAKVRVARKDGLTPLHVAAAGGHTEAVELLVSLGAEIDAIGRTGMPATALSLAASNNRIETVAVLLELGADASKPAGSDSPLAVAEALENTEVVQLLKEHARSK